MGLHLSNDNLSAIGLIGYVVHNCPTIKDAWDVLQKNQRLLSGWISYGWQTIKGNTQCSYTIDPVWMKASPHTAWQAADNAMGAALNVLHILTGRTFYPKLVEFVRPKPAGFALYEKIFKGPVKFSAPDNRITYAEDMSAIRIIRADKTLYATFSQLLQAKAAEHAQNMTFAEQVKRVIMDDFKSSVPAVEAIASHMNMSSRSFQRKLEAENISYRSISEDIKKELTLALLKNPKYNSNEISRVLGYAEPAAFRLAFKRWTNETPAQWRKKNLAER